MDHYNNDQYQYTSGPNPGQLIPSGMGEQEPQPGRGRRVCPDFSMDGSICDRGRGKRCNCKKQRVYYYK